MDWNMILKMSLAVLLYVLITAVLWRLCRDRKPFGTGLKILIGLVFGVCSVAANHIGIQSYNESILLNVRDIGPLSAGLFFSPLSGIIAGIIGGGERYLAGELWHIGQFTVVACSLSTSLAGFLAAFLHKWIYKGKRTSVPHAFFLGALMEVFHMYAVLITKRNEITAAYTVVKLAAVPMITFTAIGMGLCAAAVRTLSGEGLKPGIFVRREKVPVSIQVQRWLLVATVSLFVFNFIGSYLFQDRLAVESTMAEVRYIGEEIKREYKYHNKDIEAVKVHIQEQNGLYYFALLVDMQDGRYVNTNSTMTAEEEDPRLGEEDLAYLRKHLDQPPFLEDDGEGGKLMVQVVTIDDRYIAMTSRSMTPIYDDLKSVMYENTLSDILLFTVLYIMMAFLAEHLVVKKLKQVKVSLDKITNGDLEEKVQVRSSPEFSGLSDDINKTVTALKGYISAAEKRMEKELKLAAAIQDSALPKNFRLPTGDVELYALMTPARQVGGDFYDFFFTGIDRLCLVIADVSGKGVPASLFMMRAKTAIKNFARSGQGPAELLENVNNTLCEENDAEMFVTVWLGILDLKTGLMQCANAGHEYPVLMRAGEKYELLKDKHGPPLAALDRIKMREYEIRLRPGDRLYVYTDGVPEATNEQLEQYGTERMLEKLNRLKEASQEEMLEGVLQDIRDFAGTADQFDDITMLGLSYRSTPGEHAAE